MSIADQILTLSGVAVGATASFLATSLGERARFRRDFSSRWERRRFDAYSQYITQTKDFAGIARRIAGARGLQNNEAALDPAEGIPLLDDAEARRESLTEIMALLAGPETISAYRRLTEVIGRMEWFARGMIPDAKPNEWLVAMNDFEEALNVFHECARAELGVPEDYRRRTKAWEDNPAAWIRELRSQEPSGQESAPVSSDRH